MEQHGVVELSELFRLVPHLLDTCVKDGPATWKHVRLINRDASRAALICLKSCILDLWGTMSDSDVSGADVLQATRLDSLTVHLHLSGELFEVTLLWIIICSMQAWRSFIVQGLEQKRNCCLLTPSHNNTYRSGII